jgi:quercetin dioxygenase-like cupin family protein
MTGIAKSRFEHSSDVRPFADGMGQMHMIDLDGMAVGKAVFEPGWPWIDHVKPIAGTSSCQVAHAGYVMSGHMTIRMDDGKEENFDPGDVMVVGPGHDAWVVGNEACVLLDWQGALTYAKAMAAPGGATA